MTRYSTILLCSESFFFFNGVLAKLSLDETVIEVEILFATIKFGSFFMLVAVLHRVFLVGWL